MFKGENFNPCRSLEICSVTTPGSQARRREAPEAKEGQKLRNFSRSTHLGGVKAEMDSFGWAGGGVRSKSHRAV